MPQSLSKMFYFHPSGLHFASAQSVFWSFPSSFHAHIALPQLSAVFPIECILPVPPSHSGLPLCSVLLCIFLLTHLLCFPHMFPVMAPEIPTKGCTALCWQRDGVSWQGRHWDRLRCSLQWVGSHGDAGSSGLQHENSISTVVLHTDLLCLKM